MAFGATDARHGTLPGSHRHSGAPGARRARAGGLPARPLGVLQQDGRPLPGPGPGGGGPRRPTRSPSTSPSAWPAPSPTAPTTSATSRCPTNEMGDLYRALGQGEAARDGLPASPSTSASAWPQRRARSRRLPARPLGVLQQDGRPLPGPGPGGGGPRRPTRSRSRSPSAWPSAEPDRADYQRDLSVSYNQMGDLYRALGQGERPATAYQQVPRDPRAPGRSAEPDRADYQRDLSVSYNKMGDLYRALGQGEAARRRYQKSLEIARAPGPRRARPRRLPARPLGLLQQDGRPLPGPRPGRGGPRRPTRSPSTSPSASPQRRARPRRLPARPLRLLQPDGRPLSGPRPGRGRPRRLPEGPRDRRAPGRAPSPTAPTTNGTWCCR